MSIASRVTGGNPGSNHGVPIVPTTQGTQHPAPFPAAQASGAAQPSNQANSNNRYSGALINLLNSGLSVPRQTVVNARTAQDNQMVSIHLRFIGTIGQGTFGQIERATLTVVSNSSSKNSSDKSPEIKTDSSQSLQVAVKRVLQDPRYKNRELGIMQRLNNHPNIVKFYYYYYSTESNNRSHKSGSVRSGSSSSGVDLFLHLVLECFPESLCELIYRHLQRSIKIPPTMVKLFTYQMLKALAYLHRHRICHRDIKSSNLLVNESTAVLKVCDFGSAKEMVPGTANVSYISSRYYRAPELLFGAQLYGCAIDTWSAGCVLAEMLRQHCLFMGADTVDQLVKVIRVLGTPTPQDIACMNPMYGSYNFPDVQSCPVKLFFPQHTPADLLALMSKMLVYNPSLRISPSQALSEPCFDELRDAGPNGMLQNIRMPSGLLDPNPEPLVTTPTTETGSSANPTYRSQTDSHQHRHTSSGKKSATTDIASSDKSGKMSSGSRELAGDWQRKNRTSTNNSDKPIGHSDNRAGEVPGSNGSGNPDSLASSTKLNRTNNALKNAPESSELVGQAVDGPEFSNETESAFTTAPNFNSNLSEVHNSLGT